MREEDAVQYTTMKHENGSGNAKDVNCDVNADPSAPGGRGTLSGGVEMEHIRLGDLVQQHHALDAHNYTQHILTVAMAARISLCMTWERSARTWSVPADIAPCVRVLYFLSSSN